MLFVEEGVLAQDDLQAMGLFELTYEFSKRALKVMRNCRVDHEGNLLVDIGRGDCEQLTTDLETDSRQRLYSRLGRVRLRVSWTRPMSLIGRSCVLAGSLASSSARVSKTNCRCSGSSMSMKSITMIPPRSRSRN